MATVPASASVSSGVSATSFVVTTFPVANTVTVTITVTAAGASQTAQLTVQPPVLSSLSVTPSTVNGGSKTKVQLRISLNGQVPQSGVVVQFSTSNTAVATVAATDTVVPSRVNALGQVALRNDVVVTLPVAQSTAVTISGTSGGFTRTAQLTVLPPAPNLTFASALVGGAVDTGQVFLNAAAPVGGYVVQLASSNPAVAAVPASVTLPSGATVVTFTITTVPVAANTTVSITGTAAGGSKTSSMIVTSPIPSSLTFTPSSVIGGTSVSGQVTISGAAPQGGIVVQLSSASAPPATVPATVTVLAGATTKSFTVTTTAVPNPVVVPITATVGQGVKTTSLTVQPAVLSSVSLAPPSIKAGQQSTGQVSLNGPAPAGGRVVQLSSSLQLAVVPSNVTVAAGQTTATFTVSTSALGVQSSTGVTITATAVGITKTAQLTINP